MTSSAIARHQGTGKLSRVVTHQGTAYLSGITATDRTADVAGQTRQILEKAENLLAAVGSSKSRLLYVQIWLRNVDDFAAMNEAWLGWVDPDALPARATVEARMALSDILVEIQIVAAV